MQQILAALGTGTNDVLAAFLGSICGAFMLTQPTAKAILATVFVGTCVGTYAARLMPDATWKGIATLIIGSLGTAGLLFGQEIVKRRWFNGDGK